MIQYIDKDQIRLSLRALNILDALATPPEDDWLRIISSGVSENKNVWYIIDNGSGDVLTVIFTETGVFIKGFDHENELNQFAADEWDSTFFDRVFSGVPREMLDLLTEEERDYTTFCIWYLNESDEWYQNENNGNDGGKEYLLGYIHKSSKSFYDWAVEYYDREFDYDIIKKLFENGSLLPEEILILNPECDAQRVLNESV